MTIIAAPLFAKSNKACRIAAAADASTPQVGWLTTNTSGRCRTSRPITNFCKLPPDNERAAFAALGVRTSKASIIRSAKSRAADQFNRPPFSRPSRVAPVSIAFSTRDMSGAAAWPRRSSGALKRPILRRALGPISAISRLLYSIMPTDARVSPDKEPSNSSWPLPATPPIPRISPLRKLNEISRKGIPNADAGGSESWSSLRTTSPGSEPLRLGVFSVVPTIISAMSRAVVSAGTHVPTTLPKRKIVAVSHSVRISSNLCEIYKIAVPSARSLFNVSNKTATSWGVRTDVGSSMISNLGSCKRHRIISTRCCSPADKSPTIRSGESGRP